MRETIVAAIGLLFLAMAAEIPVGAAPVPSFVAPQPITVTPLP